MSPEGLKSVLTLIFTSGSFLPPGYAYISRKTRLGDDGDECSLQNYAYLFKTLVSCFVSNHTNQGFLIFQYRN